MDRCSLPRRVTALLTVPEPVGSGPRLRAVVTKKQRRRQLARARARRQELRRARRESRRRVLRTVAVVVAVVVALAGLAVWIARHDGPANGSSAVDYHARSVVPGASVHDPTPNHEVA